jgi:hypothetical protein
MFTKNKQRAMDTERKLVKALHVKPGDDWSEIVGDLLADLRHLADREGFDFDAAVEHSATHYETEKVEDNYPE